MVIVNLMGGMGNQLFQYASAYALAKSKGVELKLNNDSFEKDILRDFALSPFGLAEQFATEEEKKALSYWHKDSTAKLWFVLTQGLKPYYKRSSFREATMKYDPHFFDAHPPVYLQGYWQSSRYFMAVEDELRDRLTLVGTRPQNYLDLSAEMRASTSASVHIRRGDYVNDPAVTALLGLCTPEYYQRAVQHLVAENGVDHLFVFSDDLEWVKENLDLGLKTTYVDRSLGLSESEEMCLMSVCDHHIIANSSFSWWGAWLDPSENKTVIAPSNWFVDPNRDPKDIIPDEWLKL